MHRNDRQRRARRAGTPWFVLNATFATALVTMGLNANNARALDYFGPPPSSDPSAHTPQPVNPKEVSDNLENLPHAFEGALELPNHGHGDEGTVTQNNVIRAADQTSYNYPTGGFPSMLFGAASWTQKLLMFEEFGLERLDPNAPAATVGLPPPSTGPAPFQDPNDVARSGPETNALDLFLKQRGIAPFPTELSNVIDANPWKPQVESYLQRSLAHLPAEGRPPGRGWAHQRWNEFTPQYFFKTVQVGSRPNGGARDQLQRHGYQVGEFGPGGLYHNTTGLPGFEGTTRGIQIRIHPSMPVQDHKSVWTFDGTLPPKLLVARQGLPTLMRHYNALPIDPAANRGFGLHTITTHAHNGHNPAESDGFANAFFFPGQYYDYRWPKQLAGYDSINTTATDPRAALPCSPGEQIFINDANPGVKTCQNGTIRIRGDWRETVSSQWFHDHMLDFTAMNVYKGNAAVKNLYSALDRGNEAVDDGVNLRLPSGSALEWGNRDYDVNLVVADKAWDRDGQLWFNPFNNDGFIGDRMTVNWQWNPYLDVRARKYRFRLLNGSVSRYFSIALVREVAGSGGQLPGPDSKVSYSHVPFHLVANDGNIMEHAIPFDGSYDLDGDGDLEEHNAVLPVQAIGERYDIVVDFARHGIQPGDKLYLVNLMEHDTGIGAKRNIPLRDVLSGRYRAVLERKSDGTYGWKDGDPAVGMFMQLRVHAYAGTDLSMNPAEYEPPKPNKPAGRKMIPLWLNIDDPAQMQALDNARRRDFVFGRSSAMDELPWTIKTDGGDAYNADPRRISAAPQLATGPTAAGFSGDGTREIWTFKTGGGWSHPIHVHFEEGITLSRDGRRPPEWERWARKDIFRVGPEQDGSQEMTVALQFREFAGTFVEHCHNTQHEDNSMLLRWDLEFPGQVQVMPTPIPTWEGVHYEPSVGIPSFRTGAGFGPPR